MKKWQIENLVKSKELFRVFLFPSFRFWPTAKIENSHLKISEISKILQVSEFLTLASINYPNLLRHIARYFFSINIITFLQTKTNNKKLKKLIKKQLTKHYITLCRLWYSGIKEPFVIGFVHRRTSYEVLFLPPTAHFENVMKIFMKVFCLSLSHRDMKIDSFAFPSLAFDHRGTGKCAK